MEIKPPQKRSTQEQGPGTSKKKKSVPATSSESPPPPTGARSSDLPHLQTCVESIKALALNRHLGDGHGEGAGLGLAPLNESPSNCYVLLLAFLCHLKVDQTTLFEAVEQSGHGSELSYNAVKGEVASPIGGVTGITTRKLPLCPPMEATPAFRAVLEDTSLFRSLIAILSSKPPVTVTGSGTAGNATNKGKEQQLTGMTPPPSPSPFHLAKQGGGAHPGPTNNMSTLSLGPSKSLLHSGGVAGGRKRSLSVSSERSEASVEPVGHNHPQQQSKVPKLLHSPHPSQKASGAAVVGGTVATDSVALLPTDFYPPVFAAVILYSALRHVDHWPAPLVGAFAEDCFGPRLWVDDDRCKPLVENLKLVLKQQGEQQRRQGGSDCVSDSDRDGVDTFVEGDDARLDMTTLAAAKRVADRYNKECGKWNEDSAPPLGQVELTANVAAPIPLSSTTSVDNAGTGHILMVPSSSKQQPNLTTHPHAEDESQNNAPDRQNADDSSSSSSSGSDSGDEEIVEEVSFGVAPVGNTSSSDGRTTTNSSSGPPSQGSENERSKSSSAKSAQPRSSSPSRCTNDSASVESSSASEGDGSKEKVILEQSGFTSVSASTTTKLQVSATPSLDKDASFQTDPPYVDVKKVESNGTISPPPSARPSLQPSLSSSSLMQVQETLDLTPLRPRYVGSNRDLAYKFISDALEERLRHKTKQNSRLLSTLPSFAAVPRVRSLATGHLERWLQSPALSGLARSLFSSIVSSMRNVDPPLKEDINAIDDILSMRLKANQLSAHIENVTSIARNVPTPRVSKHLFLHLFREELNGNIFLPKEESSSSIFGAKAPPTSDALRMAVAVHDSLPKDLASEAMASAILSLAAEVPVPTTARQSTKGSSSSSPHQPPASSPVAVTNDERVQHIFAVRCLIRNVSAALGTSYDGRALVASLLASDGHPHGAPWQSYVDWLDDVARLAWESATLIAPVPASSLAGVGAAAATQRQKSMVPRRVSGEGVFANRSAPALDVGELDPEDLSKFSCALLATRKVFLRWCVGTYTRALLSSTQQDEETEMVDSFRKEPFGDSKRSKRGKTGKMKSVARSNSRPAAGAGAPDFGSILDGHSLSGQRETSASGVPVQGRLHHVVSTIHCLLFLTEPDSSKLLSFLSPWNHMTNTPSSPTPQNCFTHCDQPVQVSLCSSYGCDVDDEIIRIIIASAASPLDGLDASLAFSLLDDILLKCQAGATSFLRVSDSDIVWELYELTEYRHRSRDRAKRESEERAGEEGTTSISPASSAMESVRMVDVEPQQPLQKEHNVNGIPENDETAEFMIPRIAYPGLWWRATAISLVLCGSSPQKIGLSMWKTNPTIQALMKMSISDRYRFPTIDCDEDAREAMKRGETEAREMESNIAAKLFLPKPEVKRIVKDDASSAPFYSGARVSARQREKQAKVLSQQRRKEEAAALAEAQRRKRLVKEAQKTIMLLDPRSTARKPPKDAVGLFLSINELFGLPDHFRQCTDPDFLVKTFDSTSRESIERAYDWLIPIISSHPDVIDRLPPGASCFLLLRAYGTDGDSKSGQLLELSSPLLRHVSSCLKGSLGEEDAVRAADLLLADISDRSPDRRRCARRVLQEAIGSADTTGPRKFAKTSSNRVLPALHSNCDWLFDFVDVKHASILLPNVINCVSCALAFERGGVLRAYVLALHRYTEFVTDRNIKVAFDFVRTLCELLSARSHVCSTAMDRFHDFRDLALAVVHHELEELIERGVTEDNDTHQQNGLSVKLCVWEHHSSFSDEKKQVRESIVDLSLLQAAIVLLSNWQDDLDVAIEGNESIFNEPQNEHVRALTRYLIYCPDDNLDDASLCGAAGATFVYNKKRALSVEEWTMLAKSRCSFIARHAALSAPVLFLPRLLLCCGLPRTSFSTMLERLGKLGDSSEEPAKRFKELLSPSATSEWGVSHIGNRRAIARKLLGRVTAYMRHLRDQSKFVQGSDLEAAFKSSFVLWLAAECEDVRLSSSGSADKSKRRTPKKGAVGHGGSKCTSTVPEHLESISNAKFRISRTSLMETSESHEDWSDHDEDIGIDWGAKTQVKEPELEANSSTLSETVITSCCQDGGNTLALESRLKVLFHEKVHTSLQSPNGTSQQVSNGSEDEDLQVVAQQILSSLPSRATVPSSFVAFLMKWIPLLTQSFGNASLWKVLFTSRMHSSAKVEKSCQEILDMLVSRCAEVWCDDHIRSCQRWILSGRAESEKLWNTRAVSFLLMTSQQRSFHLSFVGTKNPMAPFVCIESDTLAKEAICLALECSETADDSVVSARESHEAVDISTPSSAVSGVCGRLCTRNRLPDFLTLILLIAQSEKSLCQLVVRLLLDQLSSFPRRKKVVEAIVLRLYAYYPTYVSLGDLRLRETLLDAAACYASSWPKWRSLYDEQAHTMILSLAKNPNQRLLQAVSDFAKQHPLLLAREFTPLVEVLEADGLPASRQSAVEKRGRVYASMYTFATANTYYGMVRVKPRHWGDSFTESLWVSVLDVLGSIPDEVTYHPCSREMGLLKLLGVYVKLIATQAKLKNDSDTSRLKLKFMDELSSFQQSNKREFNEWVEGKIEDIEEWGTVREVLASCGVKVNEIHNAAATNPPVQNGQNVAR